jgi:hypothetical protein
MKKEILTSDLLETASKSIVICSTHFNKELYFNSHTLKIIKSKLQNSVNITMYYEKNDIENVLAVIKKDNPSFDYKKLSPAKKFNMKVQDFTIIDDRMLIIYDDQNKNLISTTSKEKDDIKVVKNVLDFLVKKS